MALNPRFSVGIWWQNLLEEMRHISFDKEGITAG
jgi:hypothetical protein